MNTTLLSSSADQAPPPTLADTSRRRRLLWTLWLLAAVLTLLGFAAGPSGLSWSAWLADIRGEQAALIIGEIRALVQRYGVREIHFLDDVVTANKKFVREFCDLLKQEPYKLNLEVANGLRADMVKPGAAVIDIGINQISGPNGETLIVGDVDTDNVKEVASWVTPVPGGVGPVTVAMFMRNAITAHEKQLAAGWLR